MGTNFTKKELAYLMSFNKDVIVSSHTTIKHLKRQVDECHWFYTEEIEKVKKDRLLERFFMLNYKLKREKADQKQRVILQRKLKDEFRRPTAAVGDGVNSNNV